MDEQTKNEIERLELKIDQIREKLSRRIDELGRELSDKTDKPLDPAF